MVIGSLKVKVMDALSINALQMRLNLSKRQDSQNTATNSQAGATPTFVFSVATC
jgi:hypothetical protein